ncbi:MAG: hypothetical protein HY331_15640 [Chloroflexi bacterium]|nr:hypothetical protein [Chloroflexota bacterium]
MLDFARMISKLGLARVMPLILVLALLALLLALSVAGAAADPWPCC